MATALRIKDHWAEQRIFYRRVITAGVLVVLLAGLVMGRLIQLQVMEHEYFSAQSQGNRIRVQPVPPTRGLIFDRNGHVLAENLPSYQLELIPEQVPSVEEALAGLVELDLVQPDEMPELRKLIASHRSFEAIPVKRRLTDEEVALFAVHRPRFPGVDIRARLTRSYPDGPMVSHAIGYVGGINAEDKAALDPVSYAGTSQIGKISLERSYEETLHGQVGHEQILVNAMGRSMQPLERERSVPGDDLYLSLDITTQAAAWDALEGWRGAVVAIQPQNGEILAFVSRPGFDPNEFASGISQTSYRALQQDPDRPLFNRALRGSYPPGSTIKPLLALGGLEHELVDPEHRMLCRGFYTLPGSSHRYRDWKREGHGLMDMNSAVAQSCDTYFYDLARHMGIDVMAEFLTQFGLGELTGIDVAGEKYGLVPTRAWKKTAFSRREDQVWFPGETVIAGIGQGYMLTTPLQLAHVTATVATRGKRLQPTLVKGIHDPMSGETRSLDTEALPSVEVAESIYWDQVIGAMVSVVHGARGTARAIGRDAGYLIAGKSGTAQVFTVAQDEEYDEDEVDERMRDHALFVAFAPAEEPRIAVAVIVENGGSGSGVAAPVARAVMDAWLQGEPG